MFPCTHCQQPENKTIEQNVLLILWKGRNMDLCLPELTCLLKRNICWSQTFRQHLPSGVDHAPFTVCLLLYACWRQLKQHQDIVAGTASSLSNVFLTILKLKFVLNAKVFFRINYKVLEVFSWFEQQRASVLKSKTGLVKFSRPFCVLSVILLPVLPRSITKRALFILLGPEALPPCRPAASLQVWAAGDAVMDVPQGLSVGGGPRVSHTLAPPHSRRRRCQPSRLINHSRLSSGGEQWSSTRKT